MAGEALLEDRTLVVAALETDYAVDAVGPNLPGILGSGSILVSNCDVKINAGALDRENYSASLSKDLSGVDRMIYQVTFRTELRASGVFGQAPRIGRLIRACGFQETAIADTSAAIIGSTVAGPNNTSADSAAIASGVTKTTKPTSRFDTYRATVVTGGAQGTAELLITSAGFPEGDTVLLPSAATTAYTDSKEGTITYGGDLGEPTITFGGTWAVNDIIEVYAFGVRFYHQVVTGATAAADIAEAFETLIVADARLDDSAAAGAVLTLTPSGTAAPIATAGSGTTAVTLGSSGGAIALPTFGGSLVVGDYWDTPTRRPGVRYDPVSEEFDSVTLYVYFDGQLIRCTGARGTFTWTGEAGKYPTIDWTFTGVYNNPIDAAVPSNGVAFEKSKPWKVELAELAVYGMPNACAQQFGGDLGNTVVVKDCINASEAYDEVRITDRNVTLGTNPEATKPSIYNPWIKMQQQAESRFHVLVGKRGGQGNKVHIQADRTGFAGGAEFANRNKIRAYQFNFKAGFVNSGDDEISFTFA